MQGVSGIDKRQQMTINIIIVAVSVATAVVGIMAYRDNKKHQKMQQDLFAIDREIKLLRLAQTREQAQRSGLI